MIQTYGGRPAHYAYKKIIGTEKKTILCFCMENYNV